MSFLYMCPCSIFYFLSSCLICRLYVCGCFFCFFFFSDRRRHPRCALVTGVQTCALPICYSMVEPQVLRAIDFGVPQRRERAFLLIHRNDRAAPEYPKPTHGEADDFFLHPTPRVRDAFDGLHDADDYDVLWNRDWAETGTISPETRYGRIMACPENDATDLSYQLTLRRDKTGRATFRGRVRQYG